jgi:hypothetical protein
MRFGDATLLAKNGDGAAALRLYASAGAADAQQLFIVISNFPGPPRIHDPTNESAYIGRVEAWEELLRQNMLRFVVLPLTA